MMNLDVPSSVQRKVVEHLVEVRNTKARQEELMWLEGILSPKFKEIMRENIFEKMMKRNLVISAILGMAESVELKHEILSKLEIQHCEPENVLFEQGDPANVIYFVARGCVVVHEKSLSRRKMHSLRKMKEGQHLGEIGLIYDCPRTMQAQAKKYCILARMSRSNLESMIT